MITNEEKEQIILAVIERVLVKMPTVIGNLMAKHAEVQQEKKKFFDLNKDFLPYTDLISDVVQKIEGEDLTKSYSEILNEATPEIRKRISLLNSLNIKDVNKPIEQKIIGDYSNGVL